jgi:endonuclease/exonuclease/phosphatase family metal-dependent hydrolase
MGFRVATFNLKDFVAPSVQERDRFTEKVRWTAELVASLLADVVAFQEIGEREWLDLLLNHEVLKGRYPHVAMGSADARGIRSVIVSSLPTFDARVHTADALPVPTLGQLAAPEFAEPIPLRRGVVEIEVRPEGFGSVRVITGHFKSRRPVLFESTRKERKRAAGRLTDAHLRSVFWRAAEATFMRTRIDKILDDGESHAVVLGDFNDTRDSVPLRLLRGQEPTALVDVTERLAAGRRYTSMHDGRREQIDHLLVSDSLNALCSGAGIENGHVRQHPHVPNDKEIARGASRPRLEYDSDHAPIWAEFMRRSLIST